MALGLYDQCDYNNLFGIFIGIEKFPNSSGEIKCLFHANQDAEGMYRFFLKRNQCKKRKDELCLLVDEDFRKFCGKRELVMFFLVYFLIQNTLHKTALLIIQYHQILKYYSVSDATRANILRKLTQYLKSAKANDLLLLYISTHGIIDFDDYFFIPSDGEIDNVLGTGVSSTTLIQALGKASGRGVKVLMIIDTCHAGAVGFDVSKYKGEFSCLLSCSPVEYSYEYFNIEHGFFTNYLIKGLEGEASENDEGITLIGLYNYVYKNVQREAKKQKKYQNPLLIGTMNYDTILIANFKHKTSD